MAFLKKNIFIASSPNMEADDVSLAFRLLLQPWKWLAKEPVEKFEKEIEYYMNNGDGNESFTPAFKAVAFDSARSSLYLLLKAYGIGEGDEVIMPSFTCVVIVNSVLAAGAKPVYIDTDPKTFNIKLDEIEKKINARTAAILVQHTFGTPVDVKKVRKIVGPRVKIIEDLAHILGGEVEGQKFGTLPESDAAILTFGIEKMISTMRGGMALVKDKEVYKKLKEKQVGLSKFDRDMVFTWLLNPLIWGIANPFYYVGIGKVTFGRVVSYLAHKFGLMGNIMEKPEYKGKWPDWMPAQMPGALAEIGRKQLGKIEKFNEHRREIAKIYDEELGFNYSKNFGYTPLRYPVLVKDPAKVHRLLKKEHIIAGNWYHKFLFTEEKYLQELYLSPKDLPELVKVTEHIINLPVFIRVDSSDAQKIAKIVKPHLL